MYFTSNIPTKDDELFTTIFDSLDTKNKDKKEETFNNFRDENRLCNNFLCHKSCKDSLPIDKLNEILKEVKSNIINKKDTTDFIIDNLDKFLLIMELNILISTINYIQKKDIDCWDIQEKLITFKSIEYFNKMILTDFYYTP